MNPATSHQPLPTISQTSDTSLVFESAESATAALQGATAVLGFLIWASLRTNPKSTSKGLKCYGDDNNCYVCCFSSSWAIVLISVVADSAVIVFVVFIRVITIVIIAIVLLLPHSVLSP